MKLAGTFSKIGSIKVLVIGDLILDTYTAGRVDRISPEAPVGVVLVSGATHRAGGAGNVALNLVALGSDVVVVGRIGVDSEGDSLVAALKEQAIDTVGIIRESGFPTPAKNRIIAGGQQIVRVDREEVSPLAEASEEHVLQALPAWLDGVAAVAVSDYGKGMITQRIMEAIVSLADERNIPVIVDPKSRDFSLYRGATLIKPNLKEAFHASGSERSQGLDAAAERLLAASACRYLMVTLAEEGVALYANDGTKELVRAGKRREVVDVTGAGDTVLATVTVALGNGLSPKEAAELANAAAGLAVERFGCVAITLADLAHELLDLDAGNKVFEEEHLFALQKALTGRRFTVVALYENPGCTPRLFQTLQQIDGAVLIYIRDDEPSDVFVNFLAHLQTIDFIICKQDSLALLCQALQPDDLLVADGETLVRSTTIDALMTV